MSSQGDLTAQLILIQGQGDSNFQRVIDLRKNNVNIGRAQTCDIIWGSLQISRQHATLEYINPRWYIRDSSTNGLSVNGNKLVKGELFPLSDSDIISFIPTGSVRYKFNYIQANLTPTETTFSRIQSAISPQPSTSAQTTTTSIVAENKTHVNLRSESNSDSPSSASSSVSEDSNHSESLLSLGSPGTHDDFFSFSGDEQVGSPSLVPESFEGSPGENTSKRKHKSGDTSDSDNVTLDRKKKKLHFNASSDEDSHDINLKKSDRVASCNSKLKSVRSPNKLIMMTDDQIAECDDLKTLKEHLRKCMTQLACTELNLEALKCERDMEREDVKRKQDDVKSINAAFKEETLKKIHELMESELSCAVCNEIFIQATVVDCGHTFCSFCINEWSRKKLECPICRKSFRNKSRHIEIENFIVKMYESLTPDMSSRRATSIKEREEQVKKSQEEAQNAAGANQPGRAHGANFHAFIHTTASRYVDFLAELHQINEILGPPRNTGRGARIQDRVIDAVVAGAVQGPSRGRNARGRGRNANAATGASNPNGQVQNAPLPPPAPLASRAHNRSNTGLNANPAAPIPVVTLNDSPQNAEGPGAQLRLPQFINYGHPRPQVNLIDININQPARNQ